MSGNDREPIGRKGKPLPPRSSAGRGRRRDIEQDIDQDDFNDDEEEAPVPRKGKGGKPPRGKRRWLVRFIETPVARHNVNEIAHGQFTKPVHSSPLLISLKIPPQFVLLCVRWWLF